MDSKKILLLHHLYFLLKRGSTDRKVPNTTACMFSAHMISKALLEYLSRSNLMQLSLINPFSMLITGKPGLPRSPRLEVA